MARNDFRVVRNRFARDEGLPFGRLLSREYVLSALESEGHKYRSRVFCPLVTLWAWLSQCLSQDKSLKEAVSRVLAHRVATGLSRCSGSSAAYAKARDRFPEAVLVRMAKEIGRKIHESANDEWKWRGREIILADGTGFTMPDTVENRLAYPKTGRSPRGLGFPIMRAVALISLSTGVVLDLAFGRWKGKGTGEVGLLKTLIGSLKRGTVLVADRYYPGYSTLAMLQEAGVDLVSVSHGARDVDFTKGTALGPKDHIVEWQRPQIRQYLDEKTQREMPKTILVREFALEIDDREGGKEEVVIVTTIVDPTIPQQELAGLYWKRWNVELDIRAIKHSLNMDMLRAKTPPMVGKEIWAHMLAYNLIRGTMVESAKRHEVLPRQLSVKATMQAVESFTPTMMGIDQAACDQLYDALLTTVSTHRVGNRPGRLEPRFKKRRPTWNKYMTIPRDKSHRRLAAEARQSGESSNGSRADESRLAGVD